MTPVWAYDIYDERRSSLGQKGSQRGASGPQLALVAPHPDLLIFNCQLHLSCRGHQYEEKGILRFDGATCEKGRMSF